jgi:hypothetical protein
MDDAEGQAGVDVSAITQCEECGELPAPVEGYMALTSPGEPLVIFAGGVRRSIDHRDASAPGQVTLTWKQQPHLDWSVDLDAAASDADWRAWQYRPEDGAARLALDFTDTLHAEIDVQLSGDGKGWIPGGSVGDATAPLDHVVAHWVNLPRILPAAGLHAHQDDGVHSWGGRWQAQVGGWIITIDARPDHHAVYREAAEAESFVITHTMDLRRSDGATFTGTEASEVLSGLQYALSFAVGHWTCPAVPVGFAADGTVRWSEWFPLHAGRPRRGAGWWVDTRAEDLTALIAAYFAHWEDAGKREPLHFATTSAILAVETGFVEQRLQTAYAAIEMLSWVTEVLEGGMDEKKWRQHDGGSAWRVRRLLTKAKVDTTLAHGGAGSLAEFAKAEGQQDMPNALALVRDRLTHPKDPTDIYRFKGLVGEASRLACRYLELLILHRIDYRGQIADRTKLGGWIGDSEPAPWTGRAPDEG